MWSVAFDQQVRVKHPQVGQVCLERLGVVLSDFPDRAPLAPGRHLELVVADVGVGGQMTDVGDVDDVANIKVLPPQGPLQGVGEHVSPHVADVLVGVHRRPARVHRDMRRGPRFER